MLMSEQYKDVFAGICAIQKFSKPFNFIKNMEDVFLFLWKCFKNENVSRQNPDHYYFSLYFFSASEH